MARASTTPEPSALAIDHGAVADRLHQTGHAETRARAQLQRIGEIGIEPAQQHFGALAGRTRCG